MYLSSCLGKLSVISGQRSQKVWGGPCSSSSLFLPFMVLEWTAGSGATALRNLFMSPPGLAGERLGLQSYAWPGLGRKLSSGYPEVPKFSLGTGTRWSPG